MSRTELWEAPKGSRLTGHVGFSIDANENVTLPYTALATILQHAGLRRKITTHHEPRISIHPTDDLPAATQSVGAPPPPGYRWLTPRECHGSDAYCPRCDPASPDRRAAPDDRKRRQ